MNGIIEAIKAANGRTDITDTEWYAIMNDCCSVVLKIKRQNQTIGKMNVNRHEETVDTYKFSNFCSDMDISSYQIYKEDIVSVNAEYDKEKEIILIICRLENDMEIDFEMQP